MTAHVGVASPSRTTSALARRCTRSSSRPASKEAEITRQPSETFYGGYAGAFLDLDGHPWEVAHNPGFGLDDDGNVVLPAT
jgi:hypothetical protein